MQIQSAPNKRKKEQGQDNLCWTIGVKFEAKTEETGKTERNLKKQEERGKYGETGEEEKRTKKYQEVQKSTKKYQKQF